MGDQETDRSEKAHQVTGTIYKVSTTGVIASANYMVELTYRRVNFVVCVQGGNYPDIWTFQL